MAIKKGSKCSVCKSNPKLPRDKKGRWKRRGR